MSTRRILKKFRTIILLIAVIIASSFVYIGASKNIGYLQADKDYFDRIQTQVRIQESINQFDFISDTVITLDNLTNGQPPTALISITVIPGKLLPVEQRSDIISIVANSVPDLLADNVLMVVDEQPLVSPSQSVETPSESSETHDSPDGNSSNYVTELPPLEPNDSAPSPQPPDNPS